MAKQVIIAVDAMGGDNAPKAVIAGAVSSLSNKSIKILLVGKEEVIKEELKQYTYDTSCIEIINATELIETSESPVLAIKQKKNSSIVIGLNLLKDEKAEAFVSAGNTGALLAGGTFIVGRVKGVERPALGTLIPNEKSFTFLIDSGATVDCKPSYIVQFAEMGSLYMEHMLNIEKPRVGLINIGVEKEKGNSLVKEAYPLLEESASLGNINYIGNLEARDMPLGMADVAVCDAFVGNIVLKYTEGFAKAILNIMKVELTSTIKNKIGALIAKDAFKNLKNRFDYADVGGAPFLGLNKLVVKAHGSSSKEDIKGAISQSFMFAEKDIITKIKTIYNKN